MDPWESDRPRPRAREGQGLIRDCARLLGLAAAAVFAAACDPAAPNPEPGTVRVTLQSPFGAEGAAMLEFVGPGIGATTAQGIELFRTRAGDTVRVILVRETPGVLEFAMEVPNANAPPTWRVLQVSDPANALRPVLSGYRVEYRR